MNITLMQCLAVDSHFVTEFHYICQTLQLSAKRLVGITSFL